MLNLIPKPAAIHFNHGGFTLSDSVVIQADLSDQETNLLASYLSAQVQRATGWQLAINRANHGADVIALQLDDDPSLGEE